ncbi:hypothetical protein Fmac_031019 [Flemingia macrophylla]|uniref:Uncharacterized protein n=1 Tax=Flemingia macrophylla TaxID=520843 RepID=A0ABD1L0W5_9FABA
MYMLAEHEHGDVKFYIDLVKMDDCKGNGGGARGFLEEFANAKKLLGNAYEEKRVNGRPMMQWAWKACPDTCRLDREGVPKEEEVEQVRWRQSTLRWHQCCGGGEE